MKLSRQILFSTTLVALFGCTPTLVEKEPYDYSKMDRSTRYAYRQVDKFIQAGIKHKQPLELNRYSKIDTIIIKKQSRELTIYFNGSFATIPFREKNVSLIYRELKTLLSPKFKKYSLHIFAADQPLSQLIPNYYRSNKAHYDISRMPVSDIRSYPLVRNLSKPLLPERGLYNRNIALWHSHGWYYEQRLDRWEWQRARVFQTVEDLLPMTYALQYLVPMLENAGAQVFLPRERDIQINEVIVDNDSTNKSSYLEIADAKTGWHDGKGAGFAVGKPPYSSGLNPFQIGTHRMIEASAHATAGIRWTPDIPETGEYAVSISFADSDDNVTDAHYTVHHKGGKTEFLVNQRMSGGTWVHLGKFRFDSGQDSAAGSVELSNKSNEIGQIVTADAVRFGGGMGNVARAGKISGRPRFTEAARYYLQYAGMPDTLVYNLNGDSIDYNDDYQCRGEWVNYLKGAPFGPNKDRSAAGLKIPIDLSFALHTDAGFTRNDTVIGTLLIYSTEGGDETSSFPDSMSRLANRDFADIMQTQIVNDIRAKYDPSWIRRLLWDRGYSETYRPNVPAVLLELLSHQNFLDMKFALDPRFRFDASRSIYKSMVKFIATQHNTDYAIQPLPVSHFQAILNDKGQINLLWSPTEDPLEETAVAEQYIIYTRIGDNDFDNGILIDQPLFTTKVLDPGVIYSYKVTAVNPGGESFPSEILSACYLDNQKEPVLIINGFDRVSAPATIETDEYLGFANFWDQGVPDKYDFSFIGEQYDFRAASPWIDDDAPGHGASYGDYETTIIPGNSFDFPYLHGLSIKAAGYSFGSVSDESIMDQMLDITKYKYVDLILGEEKETAGPQPTTQRQFKAFPIALQTEIKRYCQSGGNLFISGAYVGTDLFENYSDSLDMQFGEEVLKFKLRTDHAVKTGAVIPIISGTGPRLPSFEFNTKYHPSLYAAESPDAIEPADSAAATILRYGENNTSAAVAYTGSSNIIIFGFPFETILSEASRHKVMHTLLRSFDE
ncbi:xanthan lyase [bacterium]|nr:xanthan lyase [bacterium]